jgi:hypothetical protein
MSSSGRDISTEIVNIYRTSKSNRRISTEIVSIRRMSNSSQGIVRAVILIVCNSILRDNFDIRYLIERLSEEVEPSGSASECMRNVTGSKLARRRILIEGFRGFFQSL